MSTTTIETTINGTTYTARIGHEAMRSVEFAGVDVAADIRRIVTGEATSAALLAECVDGCDPETAADWQDYVTAIEIATGA